MDVKLFDSELKVMDALWRERDFTAKQSAGILAGETGWNTNTTYTLIKRCIKKGAIARSESHFMCHALILAIVILRALAIHRLPKRRTRFPSG